MTTCERVGGIFCRRDTYQDQDALCAPCALAHRQCATCKTPVTVGRDDIYAYCDAHRPAFARR